MRWLKNNNLLHSVLSAWLVLPLALSGQTPLQQRSIGVEPVPGERQKLKPQKSSVVVPRGIALVVGIATYQKLDPKDNLRFTESDADLMEQVLISPEGGNFQPENVRKLTGKSATQAAFRQSVEQWLPSVAKTGDRVVIYFAGHGLVGQDGKGYLALYDADPTRLEETGYPMDKLGEVFRSQIKAKWRVLLTDACHSGFVSRDLGRVSDALTDMGGVLSFTASRSKERAFEDVELRHGVFTYYLAEALKGQADSNGDGVITANELIDYVRRNVQQRTRINGELQTPRENQDFDQDLILGFNPSRAAHTESLAEGGLVVQANMDEVEFLLDGQSRGTVSRNAPLNLPGIAAGPHTVQAVKKGYDPDGPREVTVYPGQDTPVTVRIQFARSRKKSALHYFNEGKNRYDHAKKLDQCREAADLFKKALNDDPTYSEAALYLGRTYRLLEDEKGAMKYHEMALALDPDYVEARISYGAMLTDLGDTDKAIRQLLQVVNTDPKRDEAYGHLAHAYRLADAYDKAEKAARQALALNSTNAQAHLWLGDCLRQRGNFQEAGKEYAEFTRLTDFVDPHHAAKLFLDYMVRVPFYSPVTYKGASQKIAYRDLRNLGFFGLCACEQKLGNLNVAMQYCQKALTYDGEDPYSYFHMARIDVDKFDLWLDGGKSRLTSPQEVKEARSILLVARSNFKRVVEINPDLKEAAFARQYMEQIDSSLKQLPIR